MQYTILHAPSPLGLKPPAEGRVPGVRHMPEALRRAGLHEALGAEYAGEVAPPVYSSRRDPETKVRNEAAIADYSLALADAIGPLLDGPAHPVVVGGDCSITIGSALALRRRGRFGMLYLDGHSDCQTPEISGTGGVAGMPLMVATGRCLPRLAEIEGRRPCLRDSDIALVGVRDLFDVTTTQPHHVVNTGIRVHTLADARATGPAATVEEAMSRLADAGVEGVWLHVDVDVLDPEIMPAVDSPDPGGLTAAELTDVLAAAWSSDLVCGTQFTIYDPERDASGGAARTLVGIVANAAAVVRRRPSERHLR